MRVNDIIMLRRDEILADWAEHAHRAASARGLTGPELRNMMPSYLAWLGERDGETDGRGRALVETHLGARLRAGFNLSEIVDEFALLGRCITSQWATATSGDQPPPAEVERLYTELQSASTAVADLFAAHLAQDEQTEKRYLRELQSLANEGLEKDDGLTTRLRLRKVLDLIREALDADAAALMFYDAGSNELAMAASSGIAERELERYVETADPTSFAGRVAEYETDELTDVRTTKLGVGPALRASGLKTLFGVRLPKYQALMGVLYVGICAERSFTAREIRRIETLGAQLAIHIGHATLFAQLRDKVAALVAERSLREDFVSVLAHDLRGPLSSARLIAQRLARRPEAMDERRELAVKIESNIDRTDRMIRDLLDASRVRAGETLPLRLDTCDLAALAREVIENLEAIHGDRFVLASDESVRGVWSADELQRALWNLVTNALKYGAADRPVTVRVRNTSTGAELSVHNEGAPIPADEQARLFQPFARGRRESPAKTGWGLGLTLVRGVAEAHGGKVDLRSGAEEGTTFTITLPRDSRVR